MSIDGGFGAVAYVREGLINDVVRAIHYRHGDAFRAAIARKIPLGGVEATVSGVLTIETPVVTLREADGTARVALAGWARLRVQAGALDETCLARLTADVLVPFSLTGVDDPWSNLFLDLSQFVVARAALSIPWTSVTGSGLGNELTASAQLRQALLDAVRPMAKDRLRINLPIEKILVMQRSLVVQSVPFLPMLRLQAIKVLDGAIAGAFDVTTGATRETQGNLADIRLPWIQWAANLTVHTGLFHDEASVQAMVAVQPAVFLKWGALNIKFQVQKQSLPEGTRVDDVVVRIVPGAFTLEISLTQVRDDPFPDDHITAVVSIAPMGPFIAIRTTTVIFNSQGIGGLLDLFGGLVTQYVRGVIKDHVASGGLRANWALTAAKYQGPVPHAEGSPGQAIASVVPWPTAIDPDYLLTGIQAQVSRRHGAHSGFDDPIDDPAALLTTPRITSSPAPFKSVLGWPIRARILTLDVADHPRLNRDPSLRTVWSVEVTRQDGTSGFNFLQDNWTDEPGARELKLDLWSEDYYHASRLSVRCAHYRPHEGRAPALAAVAPRVIDITDRFRRDFPFVRWHRSVSWLEQGSEVPKSKLRASAVHKTDIRQRCKFCDTGGMTRAYNSADQTQHFASLPAVVADGFRVELCSFCFPAT